MRVLTFLFLGITLAGNSQTSSTFQLEEIMKGDDFIGHSPENIRWSFDGQSVFFDWNPTNTFGNAPYVYRLTDKEPKTLPLQTVSVTAAPIGQQITGHYYFQHMGNLMRYNLGNKQTESILSLKNGVNLLEAVTNLKHVILSKEIICFSLTKRLVVLPK